MTSVSVRILCVEDDRRCARLMQNRLEAISYAVDLAHDGEAGLQMCRSGQYDLLLINQAMPKLTGLLTGVGVLTSAREVE